eukprot:gene17318-23627_t
MCRNADVLARAAQDARSRHMRPTSSERRAALKAIVEFARERNRIIYGGYAMHALLLASGKQGVYNEDEDYIDVEFYSPTPLEDVAELCMTLSKNHEFVRGKEAQHYSTFLISIEFVRVCDVTFVPESIYHKIPCMAAVSSPSSTKVVHPQFALLDIMNMLCDPFNSHWRLDIANLVFCARALARSFFASRSSRCVVVGGCALAHFTNNASSSDTDHHHIAEQCKVSVMCTSAFIEDLTALRVALTDLTPEMEWRAFRPLLGLLDGRSEVILHGHLVAIAFDSHTRVVPSCGFLTLLKNGPVEEVRLRVAGFTQTLLNARALQLACKWNGYSMRSEALQEMFTCLLMVRENARSGWGGVLITSFAISTLITLDNRNTLCVCTWLALTSGSSTTHRILHGFHSIRTTHIIMEEDVAVLPPAIATNRNRESGNARLRVRTGLLTSHDRSTLDCGIRERGGGCLRSCSSPTFRVLHYLMPHSFLSFDVGTRNLAFCRMSFLESSVASGKIIEWEVIDLGGSSVSRCPERCALALTSEMEKRFGAKLREGGHQGGGGNIIDYVLIERQPRHCGMIMTAVQMFLCQYFSAFVLSKQVGRVVFVSPVLKLKTDCLPVSMDSLPPLRELLQKFAAVPVIDMSNDSDAPEEENYCNGRGGGSVSTGPSVPVGGKMGRGGRRGRCSLPEQRRKYARNKGDAVVRTCVLLHNVFKDHYAIMSEFLEEKKKDDLADAFMQQMPPPQVGTDTKAAPGPPRVY